MHSSGVTVFYRTEDHFSVKGLQTYSANVSSFKLALGDRMWYIVVCYVTPYDASTI